uniref:uncharacterized protein LOC122591729 n=1 Tax=Erigeron canadensis TaxID=72917 RepID=UPI001CB8ACCC|nr:uncharacterized protein LOC122591729 [Erigeron canadensis]
MESISSQAPKETTLVHVADLNPAHSNHHLRVRVVHAWLTKHFFNPSKNKSFEMVFVDELGDTIQGFVKEEWIELFRNILTDGLPIMLSTFQVGKSTDTFRYSPHAFKVNFQPETKIKVIDNFVGPEHHFNFIPFSEIIKNKLKPNEIIDIIGLVVHVGGIVPGFANNKSNKRRWYAN